MRYSITLELMQAASKLSHLVERARHMSWRERFHALLRKFGNVYLNAQSSGIIHIGAHEGMEAIHYQKSGKKVIWIEAMPNVFNRLATHLASFKNQTGYCALLGDRAAEVDFFVSSNAGLSSSIFKFGEYAEGPDSLWPDANLHMTTSIRLTMRTFDQFVAENRIDLTEFKRWVVDVQGAELLMLNGAKNSLPFCRVLSIEVSTVEVYQGGVHYSELKSALMRGGFMPLYEPQFIGIKHGDVTFFHYSLRRSAYFRFLLYLMGRLTAVRLAE